MKIILFLYCAFCASLALDHQSHASLDHQSLDHGFLIEDDGVEKNEKVNGLMHSSNPNDTTQETAAMNAKRLLKLGSMADLTTIMAAKSLAGLPYTSLQITWASCRNESLPMLALVTWGTHAKNLKGVCQSCATIEEGIYISFADIDQLQIANRQQLILCQNRVKD